MTLHFFAGTEGSLMKRTNTLLLALLALIFIASSCELFDRPETIPSFIRIDTVTLSTGLGEGSASHKIKDIWVTTGDEFIGAFELPATVPILQEGEQDLSLKAGIIVNGIASTRSIYPFYLAKEMTLNLVPDSIIDISMSTSYDPDTEFPWAAAGQEGFEEGGITFDDGPSSDTTMLKTSDPAHVFEGSYSGVIYLDTTNSYYEAISSSAYDLPKANASVILEFNYKCNNRFSVGIYANISGSGVPNELLIINPSDEWNKIYVNLSTAVSRNYTASDFNIFFEAILEDDNENAAIYLDNIKLVHF